jgi:PleD family two-component response regulator
MPPQTNQLRDQLELSSVEIRKLRGSLEMIRRKAVTEGLTNVAGRKYFDIMLSEMTDSDQRGWIRLPAVVRCQ